MKHCDSQRSDFVRDFCKSTELHTHAIALYRPSDGNWIQESGEFENPHLPMSFIAITYFEAAAFLCASQRRFTASAMRFRPSGERFLFFLLFAIFFAGVCTADVATATNFLGLPAFFFGAAAPPPLSRARTCFSKAISRSTDARISDTPIKPPLVRANNSTFIRLSHCAPQGKLFARGYDRRLNINLQMKRQSIIRNSAALQACIDFRWKQESVVAAAHGVECM